MMEHRAMLFLPLASKRSVIALRRSFFHWRDDPQAILDAPTKKV